MPLLEFRQSVQRIGLMRKYRGRLVLTKAGRAAQADPAMLWQHLASRLAEGAPDSFGRQSQLLALLCLASEPDGSHEHRIAVAMTDLGWSQRNGRPVNADQARWAIREVTTTLVNIGTPHRTHRRYLSRGALSPAALLLARTALSAE